jgi:formate dehydrogenase maturation protein FdhE
MTTAIAVVLFLVFLFLACMHVYWALFFKKITKTRFAQNDSRFYSPLCLVISILTIILALYK